MAPVSVRCIFTVFNTTCNILLAWFKFNIANINSLCFKIFLRQNAKHLTESENAKIDKELLWFVNSHFTYICTLNHPAITVPVLGYINTAVQFLHVFIFESFEMKLKYGFRK